MYYGAPHATEWSFLRLHRQEDALRSGIVLFSTQLNLIQLYFTYTRYLGIVDLHVMVAQPQGVSFAFKVVYGKLTVIKFSSKR
jgi:hypothetical protein